MRSVTGVTGVTGAPRAKGVTAPVGAAPWASPLASAPVALAVTLGPGHDLRYANTAFRVLQSAGAVRIGGETNGTAGSYDLTPILDEAYRDAEVVRAVLPFTPTGERRWCTVCPLSGDTTDPAGLVVEVGLSADRGPTAIRQRAIAERLLLSALRAQDTASRAEFLAAASVDLSESLDRVTTRDVVSRRVLPRAGTWCIVDIVERKGTLRRLAVVHPDPTKQALARTLSDDWPPADHDSIGVPSIARSTDGKPVVITEDSHAALVAAAHGEENLATLRALGFGALVVAPLLARDTVLGAITFVIPEDGVPISPAEVALASDLADRCAMALDNAQLYHDADVLRETADAANRAKSTFLGNMSHELMTPLNAIGGYVELIEMGLRGPLSPEQRKDLTRIKQNQQHLITLISEVLTFVRSENGRIEYHYTAMPLEEALDDVAEMLEGAVGRRGLTLVRRACASEPVAWADANRVRQIIMNLVMNAVKYSAHGSGRITLSCGVHGELVTAEVSDSGPGIPPDQLAPIFEPFVQLQSGLADRQGGVGLGLAISRDLARAMGGDLTVTSTVGEGSCFRLVLRAHVPGAAAR